ncbi:hypothetical protein SAMN05421759_11188 [Roseivivax lentus]|uniref:Heme oxygenase n=1 Tax=Roseivivax lentus TaxID=633194 RepID=A0A1N7P034_9RHOB|nr:biliverdin-producing heme oxygenase [Roseivivax lentus]SIT03933.1 hypothetical protein SAMN05421759_11188 [Roseivivax lentus]
MIHQRIATPAGGASRARLREATQDAHRSVEECFAPFMAAPAPHLDRFMAAQLTALVALRAHGGPGVVSEDAALLDALIDDLSADLAGRVLPGLPQGRPLLPEAVSYLTLGSRLGTEVIKRRLTEARLAVPRAFAARPPSLAWQAFRTRIDGLEGDEVALSALIEDARRGFELFRAAAGLHGFGTAEMAT